MNWITREKVKLDPSAAITVAREKPKFALTVSSNFVRSS